MKKRLTFLMAAFVLLAFLAIPTGMKGQSDYSTNYTGNVTLSTMGGSNASTCIVRINDTQYNGIKAGTSSKVGAVRITVPANTKYLHMHVAAWNGESVSLAVTPTGYSSSDIALTSNSGISGNSPFTFSGDPSTSDYYKVISFSNVLSANTELTFTATGGKRFVIWGVTSEEEGAAPAVAKPNITPNGGNFMDSQEVSISCTTDGATIYYTTNGNDPTTSSTQYTAPFTLTATTTVKAFAVKSGMSNSAIASATFTKVTPMTIAEVREQQTGDVITTGTVTSCVGTTGYIQDATAAICVFGTTLTVGDNILVSGSLSEYNGLLEITNPQVSVISSGNTINPEIMTIAQALASEKQGWYIRIEDAEVTNISGSGTSQNTTIAQGNNTVVVRGNLGITVAVNDVISLNGNIGSYNGVQIANPQNVTIQENENPNITANNVNIAYNATSGVIECTINNPVANGQLTASTTATWITNCSVNGTTVEFTCSANSEVTPRTATITLTYTYNTNQTVTKDVTVTQAAYESPHYTWDLSIASYASASTTQVTWTCDYATMVVDKANAATNANNYLGGNQTSTRFYKNSELTIAPVAGYAITNVVFNATTEGYATALLNSTWTNAEATINGMVVTVTPTDGTADIVAVISGTCGFTGVTVYYVENNNPSITASNVEIDYNVTSGAITYTINNQVAGGTLTAATADNWITLGTVGETIPFTCTANEGAERTATVTLTYTYNRATVTKNVTVTQAGNPNEVNSISEITAAGSYIVQGTIVAKSQRGFIVGDGTGYVYYYNQDYTLGNYAIGDMVKISGSVTAHNGVFEFGSSSDVTSAESSNYAAEDPVALTGAQMDATVGSTTPSLSSYVQYEGTLTVNNTYYNITSIEGAQTAKGSISFPLNTDFTSLNGKKVKVTGYYVGVSSGQYYNTMLGTIEEVVITEPSITVTPTAISAPAEGAEGSLTITYQNITEFFPEVEFCDAEGNLHAEGYGWIDAEIIDNSVVYTVSANEGEARTGYFRVYATDDEGDDVYSDIVTVNQEAYVAPTFAELPFEFNGGRADIEETDGLYQDGLGTDYANVENTKLKFDGTGDWLLLQFNERPGKLTFDIKNNSFSGGTFTVQTSEDGVNYTDLATYTELGNTQSEEFTNLGENVRYIKWIYVEKSSGNVGLGNIVLQPYVAPQEYTLSVSSLSNVELFVFDASNESQAIIEGEGSAQVLNGTTIEISVSAIDGYVLESLMVDGAIVTSQIDETGLYTFTMPTHDVTITATAIEFVAGNYVRITSLDQLTNGSKVIIAARHNATANSYYAMKNATSNKPEGTLFTSMTSGDDEVVASKITDDEDHYYWTVNVTENGYTFTNANGQVIGYTSGTNFATGGDNTVWTITRETAGENAMVAEYIGFVIRNGNTNTRAFAFNGSAFGAYATTNMTAAGYNFFLDFFVQTAASETVTQTVTLTSGWNWFSTYIAGEPTNLLQMLETSLGENGIVIKSSEITTDYYEDYGWYGDLDAEGLMNDQMYMIQTSAACTVELEGMPANPAEVEITINPGWNWIGFPSSEPMNVVDALAGFQAEEGDILKSSEASTDYYGEEFGWYGELETMEPGQGFMYYSNSQDTKTLIFGSTSKAILK